jgi:hypothetical protein
MTLSLIARILLPSALALTVTFVFWPGLSGEFIFDDFTNIAVNPSIHAAELDADSLKRAAATYQPGDYGRPLATVLIAVDHVVSGRNASSLQSEQLVGESGQHHRGLPGLAEASWPRCRSGDAMPLDGVAYRYALGSPSAATQVLATPLEDGNTRQAALVADAISRTRQRGAPASATMTP